MTDIDASKYADLLTAAKKSFLEDSSYAVAIADALAGIRAAAESRADPERAHADIIRLHAEGAPPAEISRVVRVNEARVRAILRAEGIGPAERPSAAPRRRSEARGGLPAPRPVTVRFIEPTKTTAEVPVKRRPEGIGKNAPKKLQHEDNRCPPDHKHAKTSTCFRNHLCRCAECKHAGRLASAKRRARRKAQK